MAGEDWTFWFNMTNFALGIITLLAVIIVFAAVGWDLMGMWLRRVRLADSIDLRTVDMDNITSELRSNWRTEPHTLSVPGLGLTMADGGEKIEPSEPKSSEEKPPRK